MPDPVIRIHGSLSVYPVDLGKAGSGPEGDPEQVIPDLGMDLFHRIRFQIHQEDLGIFIQKCDQQLVVQLFSAHFNTPCFLCGT